MKNIYKTFFTILILTFTTISFSCDNIIDSLKVAFPPPGKTATDDIQEDSSIDTENSEENNPENGTTEKPTDDEMENLGTNGDNIGNEETPEDDKNEDISNGNTGNEETPKDDSNEDISNGNIGNEETPKDDNNEDISNGNTGNETLEPEDPIIISPIESGKAGLKLSLIGENSDIYYLECRNENTGEILEQQDNLFIYQTTNDKEIEIRINLINKETNEYFTSTFTTIKDGELKEEIVRIEKYNVEIEVNGDYSKYENPKILVNPHGALSDTSEFKIYPITEKNITVYYITSNHGGPTNFILINDTDNDNTFDFRMYDGEDYYISNETNAIVKNGNTKNAMVSLTALETINLLDQSQIIKVSSIDYDTTDENTKYYRFIQNTNNSWTFIIPNGIGSDGEFITCYYCENNSEGHNGDHFWNLLNIMGINGDDLYFHFVNQTTEWHSYIKQIIDYLQDERGLTVYNIPDFLQD